VSCAPGYGLEGGPAVPGQKPATVHRDPLRIVSRSQDPARDPESFTIDSQDVEAGSPRQSPELFPIQQPLCDDKGEKEKRRSGDTNGHKSPLLAVEWRGRQDGDGAGSNGRSTLKHRARCPSAPVLVGGWVVERSLQYLIW
jgi:hypothetical protein